MWTLGRQDSLRSLWRTYAAQIDYVTVATPRSWATWIRRPTTNGCSANNRRSQLRL
ncbi:MAG: hypothetical protein HZY76_21970 [Anaerolineae bacterium]|nr:MAG: hypothetical protein HZY76_21970 [Anaerolineae bacterium]